jgi:hypothetical protein
VVSRYAVTTQEEYRTPPRSVTICGKAVPIMPSVKGASEMPSMVAMKTKRLFLFPKRKPPSIRLDVDSTSA